MGKKETVELIVEGGKAAAGPAVGSTLGPLQINIGNVLTQINEKTKDFKGMKVPVKIIVDVETKNFEIVLGTPSASELIKNEIGIEKGAGDHKKVKGGVISLEQLIKIAQMKSSNLIANNLKSAVKMMVGSCVSLGVLIDGKEPKEIMKEIEEGKYDKLINNKITEVPSDKKLILDKIAKEIESKKKQVAKEKEVAAAQVATPAVGTTSTIPAAKKDESKSTGKK
jgi:large subunit ribosomal protein L11